VNVDASNEIESVFTVGIDTVDNSFVGGIEESVEYDDASEMDVTTFEVESTNISAVMLLLDIGGDDDDNEYSVEFKKFSFVFEKVLGIVGVNSDLVVTNVWV
jgi:hypothetical protein